MKGPEPTIDQFYVYLKEFRRPNTCTKYRKCVTEFLAWCAEFGVSQEGLPENVLYVFQRYLLSKGLAFPSTQPYKHAVAAWLAWRKLNGFSIGSANPELVLPQPRQPQKDIKVLTPQRLRKFLLEASKVHEPYRTLMLLLPFCGLRIDEMVSLKVSDIQVLKHRGSRQVFLHVTEGKGGKSRDVLIFPDGQQILLSYLNKWRSKTARNNPWLFPSRFREESKTHVTARRVGQLLTEISKRIQTELSAHTMRRMYATTINSQGIPENVISVLLGHAPKTTAGKSYVKISKEDLMEQFVSRDVHLVREGFEDVYDALDAVMETDDYLKGLLDGEGEAE